MKLEQEAAQPERRHEDFLKANEALTHFPEPRSQRAK
jgi:hypothetical protein